MLSNDRIIFLQKPKVTIFLLEEKIESSLIETIVYSALLFSELVALIFRITLPTAGGFR